MIPGENKIVGYTTRNSVEGSRFWFNCNPAGPEHWFFREWICKREQKNMLYLHFTMEDNPALSPSIRARYEGLYTGVFYDRYVRGLWVAAEGLIYDMFQPEKHLLSREPECAGDWYVSVDYGTSPARLPETPPADTSVWSPD